MAPKHGKNGNGNAKSGTALNEAGEPIESAEDETEDDDTDDAAANGISLRNGRAQLPEGYERVNSAAPVWLVKKAGVKMEGILVGRFLRKGDQSKRGQGSPYFYQFTVVNNAVEGTIGSKTEDTQETIPVAVGEIISVDESEALKDLEPFVSDGGKYQVCLVFGRKQKVSGTQRTFWPVEIGKRTLSAPTPIAKRIEQSPLIS